MSKQEHISAQGKITEALGYERYRILLDNGTEILGTISGRMRQMHIRIVPGDRVQVDMSPYDLSRGRISYRFKTEYSNDKETSARR